MRSFRVVKPKQPRQHTCKRVIGSMRAGSMAARPHATWQVNDWRASAPLNFVVAASAALALPDT